jgi:hypothetical protein
MNLTRSMSVELNPACDLGEIHPHCPNRHPDRYKYSPYKKPITDDLFFEFWKWAREKHYFRGVVSMSNYNEPTLIIDRIRAIMARMKAIDPGQPFQLVTNREDGDYEKEFDIVKRSRYRGLTRLCTDAKPEFDGRILVADGEPAPYSSQPQFGHCLRGCHWELIIGFHGEVHLCCADWMCSEISGSICVDDWEECFQKWKSKVIRWHDEESYNRLPHLCRVCLNVNPSLHFREDVDLIRRLPPQRHKDFGVDLL